MKLSNLFQSRLLGGRPESVHDYVGVLVPLEQAHLHSHSARTGKSEFEEARDDEESEGLVDGEGAAKDGEQGNEEETGMLQMSAAEYTIEGLKKAVRKGERGQSVTEYTRECRVRPASYAKWVKILMLGGSEIKTHEQGYSGHWDGKISVEFIYPLWFRMVCRQVSLPSQMSYPRIDC